MAITPLPTPPDVTDMTTFESRTDALLAALPTFVTQANVLAAALTAIAAGTAVAIPYTFSTTTTDADPGAGFLRLDNATQNAATTIRADLTGADGSTWADVLATFDDSTSTVKGHIVLQAIADPTKWILFTISALASPAGYKNITVAVVAASAASPFANNDSIILKFTRTGDKGTAGTGAEVGDHEVVVHTGNGHGSTNAKIRRFTTTMTAVGTAVTYADSASLGAAFTIVDTGLYAIHYSDQYAGGSVFQVGISRNSAEGTTAVASIAIADRLAYGLGPDGAVVTVSRTVYLAAGDVVRPHTDGLPASVSNNVFFAIRKVGNV